MPCCPLRASSSYLLSRLLDAFHGHAARALNQACSVYLLSWKWVLLLLSPPVQCLWGTFSWLCGFSEWASESLPLSRCSSLSLVSSTCHSHPEHGWLGHGEPCQKPPDPDCSPALGVPLCFPLPPAMSQVHIFLMCGLACWRGGRGGAASASLVKSCSWKSWGPVPPLGFPRTWTSKSERILRRPHPYRQGPWGTKGPIWAQDIVAPACSALGYVLAWDLKDTWVMETGWVSQKARSQTCAPGQRKPPAPHPGGKEGSMQILSHPSLLYQVYPGSENLSNK